MNLFVIATQKVHRHVNKPVQTKEQRSKISLNVFPVYRKKASVTFERALPKGVTLSGMLRGGTARTDKTTFGR